MTNWKEIHPNFTEELQEEWENKHFNAQGVKKWINLGLQPNGANYAEWLRDVKQINVNNRKGKKWMAKNGNDQELRTKYQEYKEWADIHKDFAGYLGNSYQNKWKKLSFTPANAQSWIAEGLKPKDYDSVFYAKLKGYQPAQINRIELRAEYEEWIKTPKAAQEYLDNFYHQEEREQITELDISIKNLTGELYCSDFVNLESLNCSCNKKFELLMQ